MTAPKYFTIAEMTATSTGLANSPDSWGIFSNLMATANKLDVIREAFGAAIRVNSGYRSKAVNTRVGGVSTSAHLQGLAADICAYSASEKANRELYFVCLDLVRGLDIDQLILYTTRAGDKNSDIRFVHIGFKSDDSKARHQLLYK